jgi:outer membrane cobalamin receptor
VELACASEDAPCNLPNAFLADPPLDQVVATSAEAGLRGSTEGGLRWHIGAFHTINDDDILFQTTGGPQANVGYFANVGDTRRAGIEFSLSQRLSRLRGQMKSKSNQGQLVINFTASSERIRLTPKILKVTRLHRAFMAKGVLQLMPAMN